MELGGIEPPSAKQLLPTLRLFPCFGLTAVRLPGYKPPELSLESEVFPYPSVVSPTVHHYFCYRAVVIRPCVASRLAVFLGTAEELSGKSEVGFVAVFSRAPFYESEQLVSHRQLLVSTSKPISPLCMLISFQTASPSLPVTCDGLLVGRHSGLTLLPGCAGGSGWGVATLARVPA